MTAEEVWREACAAYEDAAEEHPEMSLRDMVIAGDKAAVSVIRTAMEAYAAEKVEEERAAIVEWLGRISQGVKMPSAIAQAIAANQHHGGNDAD